MKETTPAFRRVWIRRGWVEKPTYAEIPWESGDVFSIRRDTDDAPEVAQLDVYPATLAGDRVAYLH